MRVSRLFWKTLLIMVVLFGLIAGSTSLLFSLQLDRQLTREYEDKAVAITRSMAESDLEALLTRDAAAVQSRIDGYLDLEGVSYVIVTDEHGTVIAHTFVPVIPDSIVAMLSETTASWSGSDRHMLTPIDLGSTGDYLNVTQPILGGIVGFVHVGMDRAVIRSYIRSAVLRQLGLTALVFLLCTLLASLLARNISRPLLQLANYAKKVASHDFSATIDIDSKDEVGGLATAMRSMSSDIAHLVGGLEQAVAQATDELQDALNSLSAVVANMADGLLVADQAGRILRCNPALTDMFGLADDPVGELVEELLGEEVGMIVTNPDGAGLDESGQCMEILARTADDRDLPLDISVSRVHLKGRAATVSILRNATERKRTEQALEKAREELEQKVLARTSELSRANIQLKIEVAERRVVGDALRKAEEKYRSIFENAVEGIYQTSPRGRLINANPAAARIHGYDSPEELMAAFRDSAVDIYVDHSRRETFVELMLQDGQVKNFESRVRRRDGRVIWVSENARVVRGNDGEILYFEGSIEDISQRKEAEARLVHQAYHDPLTGLPNRSLFQDHLQLALNRAARRTDYNFAVLYLDLDRFKIINDSLGHDIGDELLRSVARVLENCARKVDTIARFGGDEFGILLEELTAPREAIAIARRILGEIARPLSLGGHEVFTSASIGIVLDTSKYSGPEAVLRDADTAMYRAKEAGKSRFKVFNQKMHVQALRLMELETDLRHALELEALDFVYQPIVCLKHWRISGFEALVRWNHPVQGAISPEEFIPLAEDSGLVYRIDFFVLQRVIRDILSWQGVVGAQTFSGDQALTVNVNLSGKHFQRPTLSTQVAELLREAGLAPGCLNLEITESALMENPASAFEIISKFKAMGLGLCVDDFGTGYSSLAYLQRFPIDTIKVDRAFVRDVVSNADSQAIVRTIISLGHSLGLKIVAEGVENRDQLDFLLREGCTFAQGYLFSRPVSREEALRLLSARDELAIHP